MTIDFYTYNGPKNKINKDLVNPTSVEFRFKEKSDVTNVSIVLNRNIDTFNFNYAFIPKLNRYYFVKEIGIIANGLIEVDLAIDVLTTYKDQIFTSKAVLKRTTDTSKSNGYESDDSFTTTEFSFDNPFFKQSTDVIITAQGS